MEYNTQEKYDVSHLEMHNTRGFQRKYLGAWSGAPSSGPSDLACTGWSYCKRGCIGREPARGAT